MLEDTVKVKVAIVDCPALSEVPCLFQFMLRWAPAFVGFQSLAVKLRVMVPVPVFLT